MVAWSIAERELRVGARSAGTYSSRRNFAAITILAFAFLYWSSRTVGGFPLAKIFSFLTLLAFAYALLAGLIFASDSISSEKRSGTLGLLFLTSLTSSDLVIGNLFATSLKVVYGLLAAFPVMGMSLLLGGISSADFARVCLALISTLVFSLSLSLLVSCLSRKYLAAVTRALLAIIFFALVIPMLCEVARKMTAGATPAWVEWAELCSPWTTLQLAQTTWFVRPERFWFSLLLVNTISFAMLLICCLLLPWIWKDAVAIQWILPRGAGAKSLIAKFRRPASVRNQNPFAWLASRRSWESIRFLLGLLFLGFVGSRLAQTNFAGGRNAGFESHFLVWTIILCLSHLALLFKFTALASGRLGEDRTAGALELLLVTPLRIPQILNGQWQALARQLAGPVLAVIFLHALAAWGFLSLYSLEEGVAGGASGVLHVAWKGFLDSSFEPWGALAIIAVAAASLIVIALEWIALGWAGMWFSIRARRRSMAVWIALAVVLIPPAFAFALVVGCALWLGLIRGNPAYWAWFCLLLGFMLGVANALGWSFYCWSQLHRHFRFVVADRFDHREPPLKEAIRWFYRLSIPVTLLLIAVLSFYQIEAWRGRRAWAGLQREFAARGETPDTHFVPPPEIPDNQNFGAASFFKPLFDYRYDFRGQPVWADNAARRDLMTLTVTGQEEYVRRTWTNDPGGHWLSQKPHNLAAWQAYYRTNAIFSTLCSTGSAPAAVLSALSIFESELAELEKASHRPLTRFPVHYDEHYAAYFLHLSLLRNVASILDLRATAKLHNSDPAGALADIQFALRLAERLKPEPGLWPYDVRKQVILASLQPLWEGLARGLWDDTSLRAFQLAYSMDLLHEYPPALRQQITMMVDSWAALTDPKQMHLLRTGAFPVSPQAARLYPAGWRLLNQAGLWRFADETLLTAVDPRKHRIYPPAPEIFSRALRDAHVTLDPLSHMVIPWQQQLFADAILSTARAQTSVNLAVIACALEQWRATNGTYPERLDLLQPGIIKILPSDPLGGPRRKYGDISGEEFSAQARRDEGATTFREANVSYWAANSWRAREANPQGSVTEEQRRMRRKGPSGMSSYLRLGPLSGQPLRYRRLSPNRFLLYSVGWNQTDDHGKTPEGRSGADLDLRQNDWVWKYPEW